MLLTTVFNAFGVAIFPDFGILLIVPMLMSTSLGPRPRASQFELALPISAKELIAARMGADVLRILIPLAIWTIAIAVTRDMNVVTNLVKDLLGRSVWSPTHVCELILAVATATMLPYTIFAEELSTPPADRVLCAWLVLAIVCVGAAFAFPEPLSLTVITVVCIAIWGWIATRLPARLQLVSLRLERAPYLVTSSNTVAVRSDHRWRWVVPLIRSQFPKHLAFSFLLTVVVSLTGVMAPVIYLYGLSTTAFAQLRATSAWTGGLPISRRAQLLALLVPTVVAGSLFTILPPLPSLPFGYFRRSLFYGAPATYQSGEKYFDSPTKVPLQYWSVAPDGKAPTIRAAWGETSPPFTLKLPGLLLFNPYSSVEGNSQRFIDWQFARATTAVYGHSIFRGDYHADGPLPPRVGDKFPIKVLEAAFMFVYGLGVLVVISVPYMRGRRAGTRWALIASYCAMILSVFLMGFDLKYGRTVQVVMPLLRMYFMHLVEQLHNNLFLVILVASIPVALMYALVEWQFNRSEIFTPVAPPAGR